MNTVEKLNELPIGELVSLYGDYCEVEDINPLMFYEDLVDYLQQFTAEEILEHLSNSEVSPEDLRRNDVFFYFNEHKDPYYPPLEIYTESEAKKKILYDEDFLLYIYESGYFEDKENII